MQATLSLLGLYQHDNTILDGLTLPENFSTDDTELLHDNLLMETAELEVIYPDPNFLKWAITTWCDKNRPTWKWLKDTQMYDYNPIWNADYKISDRTDSTGNTTGEENFTRNLADNTDSKREYTRALTDAETTNDDITFGGTNTQTYSGTAKEEHSGDTVTETINHIVNRTGSESTQHDVSAYNDVNSFSPESKDTHTLNDLKDTENGKVKFSDDITLDNTTSYTQTDAKTGKDQRDIDRTLNQTGGDTTIEDIDQTHTGTTKTTTDTDTTNNSKYERWLRGNYGVKTTQSMIKEEQELAKFNVIDYIITDFKKRFCLMVY